MSQQLSDYAFTVRGHAYELEDEFKNRSIPWTVTAKRPSSSSWKTRLNAVGTSQRANQINDTAEARQPATDEESYIVVGVVPILMPSDDDLKVLGARGRVGTEHPKDPITPVAGMLALRVVTPKTFEPAPMKFYVLTDQEKPSGLCRPFNIAQEHVFFFSEYRTTDTKIEKRTKQWRELIANYSVGHLQSAQLRALKNSLGHAAVDEPALAAAKEILRISSSYLYAEDSLEYHRLKALLSSSDAGFGCFYLIENRDAKRFILELFPFLRSSGDIKSILNVKPPVQTRSFTGNLVKAVKLHSEDLHRLNLSLLQDIDERHGNMLIAIPPEVIYQRLSQAMDSDTIRGVFDQAVRYSMRDLQLKTSKMKDISKRQHDLLQGLVTALNAPQ